MLEPIKFLFILTGASTYLVTKYIKVGLDDPNRSATDNSTFQNQSWNELNRSANAIARLAHNSSQLFDYAVSENDPTSNLSGMANSRSRSNRFHNNQASSSTYHIALIAPSNRTHSALVNRTVLLDRSTAEDNVPLTPVTETQFRPTFEIEINEEDDRDLPKRLLQISLSTEDNSQVTEVAYYLEGDGIDLHNRTNNKFSINGTSGEIYVLKSLDRDRPLGKPQWRLNAYSKSIRNDKTLGYADILINLRDINDNYPQFGQAIYLANVSENATANQEVIQVKAIDLDDPKHDLNARVSYSIEQNQVDQRGQVIFEIEPHTGTIFTAVCCLDRERRHNYTIRVTATDGGGLKSSALVVIKLLDVNDEPPRFVKKEWHIEVDESDTEVASDRTANHTEQAIQSTPILRIFVQDNDLPSTNQFNMKIVSERHSRHLEKVRDLDYSLTASELNSNYSTNFALSTNSDGSGWLRILRPLDYEVPMHRFIVLKVVVSDQTDFTDRYHLDVCFIYIKVRDTNDNKPKFAQSFINVSLAENTILGTIITKFYATDADQNGHSQVMYTLDSGTNRKRHFNIDSEGFVRLNRVLDRETIPTHIVKVIATDSDEPKLTSTATLVVNVEDINDNAPELINTSLPPIVENSAAAKLGELFAFDRDDYSKGNGPPFTFFLAPDATEQIKRNFRLEADLKGEGKAVLFSNGPFDRETQKQYVVPVVVRDSGYPSLSSTCLVTVTVADLNDNDMKDGWKDVTVFFVSPHNMQSLHKPIEIGQVNVDDPDDWDVGDKVFFWNDDVVDSKFYLDSESGIVSLKSLSKGKHELKFSVYDRHYQHQSYSTMRVQVEDIPLTAVVNSGSLRIVDLDSFTFIATWDWKTRRKVTSLKEKVQHCLQLIIGCDHLEIFSIMDRTYSGKKALDIRYFAKSNGRFLSAVYLNGLVQLKSDLLNELSLNVTQIGINECMYEERHPCESSSCFTEVTIDWTSPSYLVHGNFTSFVGIKLLTEAKCTCYYDNLLSHFDHKFICDIDQALCSSYLDMSDTCHEQDKLSSFTRNYRTSITNLKFNCVTNRHFTSNSRSFKGNGWIWLDPFPLCTNNFLSIQIATNEPNGIIFYYGPVNRQSSLDFMLLELQNGKIRLLFDFGSGIGELSINSANPLNDGNWHQIDVHFDTSRVGLVLDTCAHSAQTRFDGIDIELDKCANSTDIPSFSELLNVNGPLQVGGIYSEGHSQLAILDKLNPAVYEHYRSEQTITSFTGCIRNLVFNSHIYDLVEVHYSHNSQLGCYSTNSLCSFLNKKCLNNGVCDGNYNRVKCICNSGYYGPDCGHTSQPVMFEARSFIHLSMIRPANVKGNSLGEINFYQHGAHFESGFATRIEFTFRSRQSQAEIVRLVGKNGQTYCLVEIRNSRITFRFNLNPARSKTEKTLTIGSFVVNDGKWHRVEAYRFGQSAVLTLDGGGIGKSTRLVAYNKEDLANWKYRVFDMNQHQIMLGGQVNYLAIGTTTVTNDFADGCLNDLKINDVHISLSDLLRTSSDLAKAASVNPSSTDSHSANVDRVNDMPKGTQLPTSSAAVRTSITKWQNVRLGCQPSHNPCASVHCPRPWVCVDEWLVGKCRCPTGFLETEHGNNCTRTSELCKVNPCLCRREQVSVHNLSGLHHSATLSRLSSSADNGTNCDEENQMREPTTVNARIFQLEYGLFVVVLVALVPLNIPFIIYIVYICCRNKRTQPNNVNTNRVGDKLSLGKPVRDGVKSQPSSVNDDIRENVVCYRDEGGGEDDVRAYDMIALRIQIPNMANNKVRFEDLVNEQNLADKSVKFDTWQELTVI